MELIFPTQELKEQALAYRQEHFDAGEMLINGDAGLDEAETYEAWLVKVKENPTLKDDKLVPSTTYFGVADGKIVGTIDIRHRLNDYLLQFGGHIGYGVRPTERRKGYATKMLALALEKCRELGLEKVLITCNKDNTPSAKTIINNGGVLENEIVENSVIMQRYWIELWKTKL